MSLKVLGRFGSIVTVPIVRRRDNKSIRVAKVPGSLVRGRKRTDTKAKIQTLLNQVSRAIIKDEIYVQLRVTREKLSDPRNKHGAAQRNRSVNPQLANERLGPAPDGLIRVLNRREDRPATLEIVQPFIGQHQFASCSVEQSCAEPILQLLHCPADVRLGDPKITRRRRKPAALRSAHEGGYGIDQVHD